MSRPGFTLEVDERTPPLLVRSSADVRLERFPLGTQVVYPPDTEPWGDPSNRAAAALAAPISGESLVARLRPGMKLTITFSDVSVPTPWASDDVRRVLVEHVLEAAAAAGVDDVALVAASGLRRRLTAEDYRRLLGERVSRSFADDPRLTSHDASDDALLKTVGEVDGVQVRLNRRVAESDLVVHVSVVVDRRHAGWDEIVSGLGSAETIDKAYGWQADPAPVTAAVSGALDVIAVAAVLGQPSHSGPLQFLSEREWEWSVKEQVAFLATRRAMATAPVQAARALYSGRSATYPVLGVWSGGVDEVRAAAQAELAGRQAVAVPGVADILVTGVPAAQPAAPDADGSPLSSAWWVLSHCFGLGGERQIVRDGGAIIAFNRLSERFSTRHHSAAADFLADVLPQTADPGEIQQRFLTRFATDPWYLELYRQRNAFHPLLAFHQWFAMQPAKQACSDIVFVGANRRVAEVLGFRAATTYADALEITSTRLGRRPAVTYVRDGSQVQVVLP